MTKKTISLLAALFTIGAGSQVAVAQDASQDFTLTPRTYECEKISEEVKIDGDIYDKVWESAQWTDDFVDIRGYDYMPQPKYRTRAKLMYDDKYLYLAFEIQEPHLWGTITKRDAVMYYDNDIEVFIDPDSDSRNYQEYEFNVLGSEWDLLMTEPYNKGGIFINNFDLNGMKTAVKCYGTVNDPSDKDEKWTFEIAMPLEGLQQTSYNRGKPLREQTWRINFSRVEWLKFEIVDGKYKKLAGKEGFGNEENWVWSPTGVVDMHRPDRWGYLKFK